MGRGEKETQGGEVHFSRIGVVITPKKLTITKRNSSHTAHSLAVEAVKERTNPGVPVSTGVRTRLYEEPADVHVHHGLNGDCTQHGTVVKH